MSSVWVCSGSPCPSKREKEVIRPSADYHPSVWGDYFLSPSTDNTISNPQFLQRVEVLKEEVKRLLHNTPKNTLEQMNLINNLQALGVSYHFKLEIEETLKVIYNAQNNHSNDDDDNLYTVALRFRLLRQHGYTVSSDVFMKFKEADGSFNPALASDAKGMLCLYEASHLSVQGEDILDEALTFTSAHLLTMKTHISSPLKEELEHALYLPFHKCMPRLKARNYISIYEKDSTWNQSLLELAKLDFNLLQSMHKRELRDISRWWKDLDVKSKLPFARDRLVECYFWILGVYFEPQYTRGRMYMTKIISMTSVIDDIYDVYGTLEELQLFTDAIERWDAAATDRLPEYMSVCYLALLDVVKELEEDVIKQGRLYCVYYAKEAMKILVREYFAEAKWYSAGYLPTFEEQLSVSTMTSGYPMLCVQALIAMGEVVTKEALDWVIGVPKIVMSSALITRFLDDIHIDEVEQSKGAAASCVVCYMKKYGVSKEEACEEMRKLVTIAWKDINQECLEQNPFPLDILQPILNFARMMEVLYRHEDGYNDSTGRTKDHIASVLVHPINI